MEDYILDSHKLVTENMGLANYYAKKAFYKYDYNAEICELDDLISIAVIGLIKAANSYNGKNKFASYASVCINNEVKGFFRKNHYVEKVSLYDNVTINNEKRNIKYKDRIPAENRLICSEVTSLSCVESIISISLNLFKDDDIKLLFSCFLGKNQNELARTFNITQSGIARRYKRLCEKVKRYYNDGIKYDKKYSVKINTSDCILSFYPKDFISLKKDLLDSIYGTELYKNIIINCCDGKIIMKFNELDFMFESIVLIIECITNKKIELQKIS